MFRFLTALLLAIACVPANATLLRVNYDLTTALNASQWLLADPPPDQVHAAFTIDTGSALSSNFNFFTAQNGDTCLGHMQFNNIAISDIAVTSGNMTFGSIPGSSSGRLVGDNASPNCPGGFFGGLGFSNDELDFIGSINFQGMSQAAFQSSLDPMADLLANAVGSSIIAALVGDWGTLRAFSSTGSIQRVNVPAPAPIALFVAGIIGFAVFKRRTRAA
jgi:hypothetical protein